MYMKFLLVLLLALLNTASADNISHLKMDGWSTHVPNIVLCNNIQIPDQVINAAITQWKQRGMKIGKVIRKSCNKTPNYGEIAFYVDDKIVGSNEGYAIRNVYSGTNDIAYARIWIKSYNLDSKILIEHELGHGLGYTDTTSSGSIMSKHGAIY